MNVRMVGGERALSFQQPQDEDTDGVVQGNHEDRHRDRWGGGDVVGDMRVDVELVKEDGEESDDEAEDQGAGVAHEDLVLFPEDIEVQERNQGSDAGRRDDGENVLAGQVKPDAVGDENHETESSCQPVDAVNERDAVDDHEHDEEGEDGAELRLDRADGQEAVKVGQDEVAGQDEHQAGDDLPDELGPGGESAHVVFDANHEDDDDAGNHKLDPSQVAAVKKDEGGYDDPGEERDPSEVGYRPGVRRTFVGDVKKPFLSRGTDDRGDGEPDNEERPQEGEDHPQIRRVE